MHCFESVNITYNAKEILKLLVKSRQFLKLILFNHLNVIAYDENVEFKVSLNLI